MQFCSNDLKNDLEVIKRTIYQPVSAFINEAAISRYILEFERWELASQAEIIAQLYNKSLFLITSVLCKHYIYDM